MGFVFLGIASLNLIGVTGAIVIMIAHGFLAALTFALSGYIYQKTGTLEMRRLGGLCRQIPFIGTALLMAALAGCGLPGFANFVGEITVFFGAWTVFPLVTALAVWGALMIAALYMLRAMRNVLHGPLPESWSGIPDASHAWRKLPYALLLASLFVFGCCPRLLTDKITPDADKIVSMATVKMGAIVTENAEENDLLVCPHPGPLPQERENRSQFYAKTKDGEISSDIEINESGQWLFPLPGGEGQGEGGRHPRISH
jgi:NADH-quinone oxidoreductase subunit M